MNVSVITNPCKDLFPLEIDIFLNVNRKMIVVQDMIYTIVPKPKIVTLKYSHSESSRSRNKM